MQSRSGAYIIRSIRFARSTRIRIGNLFQFEIRFKLRLSRQFDERLYNIYTVKPRSCESEGTMFFLKNKFFSGVK